MTPSSITLGGRGRHTQRVLKADPSGVERGRKERTVEKFISYLTCGGEGREGGRKDTATQSPPLSLSNFLSGRPRKENPFIFHFICGVAAGAKLKLCAILRNERMNR